MPHFALLETRGPDPLTLLLSTGILTALVSLSLFLGSLSRVNRAPSADIVTLLVAPPDPATVSDLTKESLTLPPPASQPVTAEPSLTELTTSWSEPLQAESPPPDPVADQPVPRELMENPPPLPVPPERAVVEAAPMAPPAAREAPKASPTATPPGPVNEVVAPELKAAPDAAGRPQVAATDEPKIGPESLGALPLSQLIEDQAGLAVGLAALPSAERLNLPRVSIRVNAAWLEALPLTQERLYFSITTPEADREVLAYAPRTHSFNLERPERPLWQIHGAERVPELVELRAAAGRALGVSPTLVGLYTWHPPVFENALRMFVLERMQELHVHLGPRDVVTVRLASGAEGAVMNLEPIREEASRE